MKKYWVQYKPDKSTWLILKQQVLADSEEDAAARVSAGFVNCVIIATWLDDYQGDEE